MCPLKSSNRKLHALKNKTTHAIFSFDFHAGKYSTLYIFRVNALPHDGLVGKECNLFALPSTLT